MRARENWCVITSIISPPPRNGGISSSTSCLQGEWYLLNTHPGAASWHLRSTDLALMQPLSSTMMPVAELPRIHGQDQDLHRAIEQGALTG